MYILVLKSNVVFRWYLMSHTGLVLARSDKYSRCRDAVRIGKQIAQRLNIKFKYE